jgi:hypothetical protein
MICKYYSMIWQTKIGAGIFITPRWWSKWWYHLSSRCFCTVSLARNILQFECRAIFNGKQSKNAGALASSSLTAKRSSLTKHSSMMSFECWSNPLFSLRNKSNARTELHVEWTNIRSAYFPISLKSCLFFLIFAALK